MFLSAIKSHHNKGTSPMQTPIALLQDLESLYALQKEGGISKDEFQNSKKEIVAALAGDDMLSAKHLKFAHELLSKKALSEEEYNQIKTAALKLKLPKKPIFEQESTFSLIKTLLYLYKLVLFGLSFVVKLFLGIINFFVINLVIDNLRGKK